jgi:hypothetical protein
MTIHHAPHTGYCCILSCPRLRRYRIPSLPSPHGNPGARSWKRLHTSPTVLCRGIELIAIARIAQRTGCAFGGFKSAIIGLARPRWVILPRQSPSLNSRSSLDLAKTYADALRRTVAHAIGDHGTCNMHQEGLTLESISPMCVLSLSGCGTVCKRPGTQLAHRPQARPSTSTEQILVIMIARGQCRRPHSHIGLSGSSLAKDSQWI